ncbi:unnamed protein product [Knipowitschia caucasica]
MSTQGKISLSPKSGQWVLWLRGGGQYRALAGRPVELTPCPPPQRVGVFVDYDEALVSFYDGDSGSLLHSFTDCSFREGLVPFFSPCNNDQGRNAAPLVLTPVCAPETSNAETSSAETVKTESEERPIQDPADQHTA